VSPSVQVPTAPLSADRLSALRNLASKHIGDPVGWIAIADARGLTDIGYARRSHDGWQITARGSEALALLDGLSATGQSGAVLSFHGR